MDPGIVCAGTACLIVPSLLWGLYILAFRLRSHQAIGTIVGHDSMEGEYGTSYAPIVEFKLPDGQMVTFTEKTHSSDSGLLSFFGDLFTALVLKRNPDKVTVIYDPKNPQNVRVNGLSYLYFGPALKLIIGHHRLRRPRNAGFFPAAHGSFQPHTRILPVSILDGS